MQRLLHAYTAPAPLAEETREQRLQRWQAADDARQLKSTESNENHTNSNENHLNSNENQTDSIEKLSKSIGLY